MDEELDTPPPSKLKAILPYVGILLVGLGGGFGASVFLAPRAAEAGEDADATAPAEGEAAAEGEATEGEKKPEGEGGEAKGEAKAEGEKAGAEGKGAEGKGAVAKAAHAGPAGSTITNLGSFTVNLRGSGGGRVLRMEVQVDTDNDAAEALEVLTPQLRDSIISVVSDYTWSELEGTDGKTRLKDELLTRINGISDPVEVRAVYLTTFVVS